MKRLVRSYFEYAIKRRGGKNSTASNFEGFFNKTEGMISLDEANLLYELAKDVTENCIVEVGSYRGRSTVALGRGSLDGSRAPVFAIDPHEEFRGILGGKFGPSDRGAFYKAMLDTFCYRVVRLINLSSEMVAPTWDKKISLLWVDGDHSYEGVKRDFYCWLPHLAEEALISFDDSTNPELGPHKLIHELVISGKFKKTRKVGKVTVIKLNKSNMPSKKPTAKRFLG